MNARFLLETIEARGGVATVKTDPDGAAKINVAPRSLALELLPELQRFKPGLLELLAPSPARRTDDEARARFPAHLRAAFPSGDRVAIGHCLLRLDAKEEIE